MKIVISAGEISGDQRAAEVVSAVRKFAPNAELRGMGGAKLKEAGVSLDVDLRKSGNVMGFVELLSRAREVFGSFRKMRELLKEWKPDALMVVDYPDFNLRLAKVANKLSIPVMYLIPPKVWAWRAGRVETIKKYVNCIASIFPFEPEFYQHRGFSECYFVGHPLVDQDSIKKLKNENFRTEHGIPLANKVIAVFPGSRNAEINNHLPQIISAFQMLDNITAVFAVPNHLEGVATKLLEHQWARVVKDDPLTVLANSDLGVLKCGTCNLEAAFAELPFFVFYKAPKISYAIARKLVSLSEASPVNIVLPGTVEELLQGKMTAEEIVNQVRNLEHKGAELRKQLKEVSTMLRYKDNHPLFTECNSSAERSAKLLLGLI